LLSLDTNDQKPVTIQVMLSDKQSKTVSSNSLSEVVMESEKAAVQLPTNGLVDANGNSYSDMVEVTYKHYNPTDDFFGLQMPIGNFRGV